MRDAAHKDAGVIELHVLIEVLTKSELAALDRRYEMLEMCNDWRSWSEPVD